jgi:hypothetical protein
MPYVEASSYYVLPRFRQSNIGFPLRHSRRILAKYRRFNFSIHIDCLDDDPRQFPPRLVIPRFMYRTTRLAYDWPPVHLWQDPTAWPIRSPFWFQLIQWDSSALFHLIYSEAPGAAHLHYVLDLLRQSFGLPWTYRKVVHIINLLASLQSTLDTFFPNHRLKINLPTKFWLRSFTRPLGFVDNEVLYRCVQACDGNFLPTPSPSRYRRWTLDRGNRRAREFYGDRRRQSNRGLHDISRGR